MNLFLSLRVAMECWIWCFLRFPFCVNDLGQCSHLKGLIPLCMRTWSRKFQALKYFLLHLLCIQTYATLSFRVLVSISMIFWWLNDFSISSYSSSFVIFGFSLPSISLTSSKVSKWWSESGKSSRMLSLFSILFDSSCFLNIRLFSFNCLSISQLRCSSTLILSLCTWVTISGLF